MKQLLTELRDEFDVRLNPLDQNYVIDLALLYESGVKLPPLKVTKTGIIVDGRNRYHAMLMAGITETEVTLISGSRSDLLLEAMASNQGSKPLTSKDVRYVIGQLMEQGMTELQIVHALRERCGYTPELTRSHVTNYRKDQHNKKVFSAAQLVIAKGLTVGAAAEKMGVSVDSLRKSMGRRTEGAGLLPLKSLKLLDKNQRRKVGKVMADGLEAYRDGVVQEAEMHKVLEHLHRISEAWEKMADHYEGRFDSARRALRGEDVVLVKMATA